LRETPCPFFTEGRYKWILYIFYTSCFEVADGVFWGGDFTLLVKLIQEKAVDVKKIRFFLGYSGWSSGQLLHEMNEKSWLTVKARKHLVFHKNYGEIWKDALKEMGGEYGQLVNYPIDPQLN
jgi:putative transcriptional regulator